MFGLPRPEFSGWYQAEVISFTAKVLRGYAGLELRSKAVRSLRPYDILVIPGWQVEYAPIDPGLRRAVLAFHRRGGRILSFCSGSFLLGRIGLLDGREATTHWRYADQFRGQFPQTVYVDNVLYVYDGQLGCSAGSAAALDLGLAVIREDFGYQVANQVARRLVIAAHRSGGQSQFVETPILEKPNQFAATLDWAIENLANAMNVDALARKANMSRRSFDRKFRESLALSPKAWLTLQRIEKTKQLLESSSHSIERVAELTGFDNAITLRHHFRKALGMSPRQYREKFLRS
ncbi:helix-turn-helix domain-containing protein [Proteobacteria bacterium 005FR1]|nr:helix-turn-helix domain-containing protein [Proteobacteria bacterium 005FR1]